MNRFLVIGPGGAGKTTFSRSLGDAMSWELDTILEEAGNCHLYEKMGYRRIGATRVVNDKMTLVSFAK